MDEEINSEIIKLIQDIKKNFMGGLVKKSLSKVKPIQFKPILSLQKSIEGLLVKVKGEKILEKDTIKDYISCISLYITDACNQSCSICKNAFKQFPCCHKTNKNQELPLNDVQLLLLNSKGSRLQKLKILGGDIFMYSRLHELIDLLNQYNLKKEYYSNYLNIIDSKIILKKIKNRNSFLNLLINYPVKKEILSRKLKLLDNLGINTVCIFIIEKDKDIIISEKIISQLKIKNKAFFPFYNGNNISFFKKHVFITKKEILNNPLTMNKIFVRKTLNEYSFRKLIILSNKDIYGNLNNKKIGKLNERNIFDFIAEELNQGNSWTKIRKNVYPCKSCVFNALCPPISNYEYAIKRWNLCNIFNSQR